MHIEAHRWHSPHLARDMSLKVYGHWGRPLIVFPCSRGRYLLTKAVPAWIDVWGHDVNHDWPWWFKQMNYFLDKLT
jgi:esterase/lipase superfamily enzyme